MLGQLGRRSSLLYFSSSRIHVDSQLLALIRRHNLVHAGDALPVALTLQLQDLNLLLLLDLLECWLKVAGKVPGAMPCETSTCGANLRVLEVGEGFLVLAMRSW